jgi:hypothetical protein
MGYDADYDVLRIVIGDPRPAMSIDLGGMWMRLEPDTGEILGFEIQDFVHSFLPKHPELGMQLQEAVREELQIRPPPIADPVGWVMAFFAFIKRMCSGGNGGTHGRLLHV